MNSTPPIYLDNAATTPLDPQVLEAMTPYFSQKFHNPSAQYESARLVKRDIDTARATIAHYLGARPSEIVFTAGGTEANNLVINGIMALYPEGHIVTTAIEHDSVLEPVSQYNATVASVLPDGKIDLDSIAASITDNTVLVSVQYANNEIGTIQSLKDVSAIISEVKKVRRTKDSQLPLYFHTDACQAPAYLDIHTSRLGVDMMTINASKIYGPKQIGALYVKSGIQLKPQMLGGGQERGNRSGTENVPSIIGFAKALSLVQDRRYDEATRMQQLQSLFFAELKKKLPQAVVNGSVIRRLANNVHITIAGYDNETLMLQLDDRGIMCAVGSACSASNEEPSHVLRAIGLSSQEAQSSLRFTMGLHTEQADIKQVIEVLQELIG